MPAAHLLPRWSFRAAVMSEQSGLSASCRLVLVALDNYRSDKSPCPFPSQVALATDTGMTDRTVRTALHIAAKAGWVRRAKRGNPEGGRSTDSYELLIPDGLAEILSGKGGRIPADTSAKVGGLAETVSEEVSSTALSSPEKPKTLVALSATPKSEALTRKAQDIANRAVVPIVFTYWRDATGKSERVMLDEKRGKKLLACLRENGGDVSELLFAVDGALKDDWLMGRDPKSPRRYDGIEHIFRDRAQIERLCELANMNGKPHPYLAEADLAQSG